VIASRAVVLARGLGTRMRRAAEGVSLTADQAAMADRGLKALVPVGRPFLDYVLNSLAEAGLDQVCLVVAPDHEALRRRYGAEVELSRVRIEYAVQAEPLGTADAVATARSVVGDDPFVVINADNLYPAGALRALAELDGPGLIGYDRTALIESGDIEPERIAKYALLQVAADGALERIVEKPDPATARALGPGAPVSMNSWRFGPEIFEACRRITPSPRGELELQSAVMLALTELGVRFQVVPWRGVVLDLSTRTDIERVRRRVEHLEVRL
jgi:glucose-1-phosphate thymidylyltransferase